MELALTQQREANLTPTQSAELQHYVDERNLILKRVLGCTHQAIDKFPEIMDGVDNSRDFRNMTEALKILTDVATPANAKQSMAANTAPTAPSVNIILNQPTTPKVVIEHE